MLLTSFIALREFPSWQPPRPTPPAVDLEALTALKADLAGKKPGTYSALSEETSGRYKERLFGALVKLMREGDVSSRTLAFEATANLFNHVNRSQDFGFRNQVLGFYDQNRAVILAPLMEAAVGPDDGLARAAIDSLVGVAHEVSRPEVMYQLGIKRPAKDILFTAVHLYAGFEGLAKQIPPSRAELIEPLLSDFTTSLDESVPREYGLYKEATGKRAEYVKNVQALRKRVDAMIVRGSRE